MSRRLLASLALPLAIVAVLAAALGFLVTQSIARDDGDGPARVSVVPIPSTPTPSPEVEPTPEPEAEPQPPARRDRPGSRTPREPDCPSGCECSFPPGGTVIVCRGGSSLRLP